MIRLGLRFSLRGTREGKIRLALTALGVALAVALLLFTISGFNGLKARDYRNGWTATSQENRLPSVDEEGSDPLWWRMSSDAYMGRMITILDVAATGQDSPVLPSLDRMPAPGEYYVSPALAELLDSTPADLLGARFPGTRAGLMGDPVLTSPETLLAVVGRSPAELEAAGDASQVRSIETAPKEHDYSEILRIALGIGAIGLMLPVLVFVVTSTRLAAARREERLAALRLVGATPGQVNVIAAIESALAGVTGTALGFVFFFVFRPLVAQIPFTGEPFFVSDLGLGPLAVTGVALGVPAAALAASLWTLRRVQISPLGVARRAPAGKPSAWRLLAPIVGLALLLVPGYIGSSRARTFGVFVVFAAIALGIVVAGPWLTYAGGRVLGSLARKDSTLIAARRLGSDSRRAFRAISGLVLAVFMGTVFVAIVTAVIENGDGTFREPDLPTSAVIQPLTRSFDASIPASSGADIAARIERVKGVQAVISVLRPSPIDASGHEYVSSQVGMISLSDWALLGGSAGVAGDDGYVLIDRNELASGYLALTDGPTLPEGADAEVQTTTPGFAEAMAAPDRAVMLLVLTDEQQSSVERVRTALKFAVPEGMGTMPYSIGELGAAQNALFKLFQRMIDVGIILSLVIAGCSLAVSVAGGLVERKRAFALLRLAGMPLRRLYWSVLLEAAVPLMVAAVTSAAAGFFVAALIVWTTGGGMTVPAPGPAYFGLLLGGLVAALAVVAAALPLVGRMTEPQSVRME